MSPKAADTTLDKPSWWKPSKRVHHDEGGRVTYKLGSYKIWPPLPKNFKPRQFTYYITYEPLALLLNIGLQMALQVQGQLQLIRLSRDYADDFAASSDSSYGNATLIYFGDEMSTYLVRWNQARLISNLIAAFFANVLIASWSDHNGRKVNMLMGIAALMMGWTWARSLLWSNSVHLPLFFWVITTFFEGCMGNFQLAFFSGQMYQADLCADRDELTVRMVFTNWMQTIGILIGTYISTWTAIDTGLIMSCTIGNTLVFVGFLWILVGIEHIPPQRIEAARKRWAAESVNQGYAVRAGIIDDTASEKGDTGFSAKQTLIALAREFRSAWTTYTKPRRGYKRACIWLMTAVNFLVGTVGQEAGIIVQSYMLFIHQWSQQKYANWATQGSTLNTIGTVIGLLLLKKLLNFRDTWILIVALLSLGIGTVPYAWPTDFNMSLANWIQALNGLSVATQSSVMTQFVEPEEVGRVILSVSAMSLLGATFQQYVLQEVYIALLPWFPGFMFLLCAGGIIFCVVLVVIVDILHKPGGFQYDVQDIADEVDRDKQRRMTARNATMSPSDA